MTDPTVRRCVECGLPQKQERRTIAYPESGLDNVQLFNVPVWVCGNRHEEVEIPAISQLHDLLAQLVIRKAAPLAGPEIRFLRKRLGLSGREFAARLGMTAVHLSRLENGSRKLHRLTDLLIRLASAYMLAAREAQPVSSDLLPLIEQLEAAWDVGSHRLRHVDMAPPDHEWEPASV